MSSVSHHSELFLDFNNLQLYGREEEIVELNEAYQRSFGCSQIVWLKGNAGVGKSALVEHVFLLKDNYCSGKFERLRTSMPYSALAQLLSKLCRILEHKEIMISSLSSADESILSNLVPEITTVLESQQASLQDDEVSSECNVEWGLERLKQALRTFLREVCDILESPLIMFLDDLQWADMDTLELLQDVIFIGDDKETVSPAKRRTRNGILFMGAYRDNEVEEDSHPLVQCIQKISEHVKQQESGDCRISELNIVSLDESATTQLVADLIDSKPELVAELSKVIYSKTDGNCFYTLHSMRHIHEKKLLYRSQSSLLWKWDATSIQEAVPVSENVAEFMMRKLKNLPPPTLDALILSSFLGIMVEIELLRSLFPLINRNTPRNLLKLLQPAVEANLIQVDHSTNGTFVKFTHDRVTAAAYSMIPEDIKRKSLHLEIGLQLHSAAISDMRRNEGREGNGTMGATDTIQWQLILAVDQLNRGADLLEDKRERVLVAKLNQIAAQQVLQTGAFKLATTFLETGNGLLGLRRWEMNYSLTLKLSVTLASVLYSSGRMEESLALLDEIFANAACSEDTYEAHSIQVEVLESMGRSNECLKVGLDTLAEVGHPKIPRKPHLGHMLVGVYAAQRVLKRMTDEDILSLPVCTDPKQEFIMRHLNCLGTIAYFASHEDLMVVMGYRVLQMSLRYGVTSYTPYSICAHACSMAVLGDLEGAFRFAELSVKLMKRLPLRDYRTFTCSYCMLYHLKKPIHECINSSMQVYNDAFSTGDLRSAGMACLMHCIHRCAAGLPLETIAKDAFVFCNQLKKYQQTVMMRCLLITLRAVMEL